MPNGRWDKVPVWGVWHKMPGETPETGSIEPRVDQRVQRVDGRVVYPSGARVSITIGDVSQQETAVRNAVRTAWRAVDEAALGEDFDGAAWDVWFDDVVIPAAIFTSFPAADDPDIIGDDLTVTINENLSSGTGKRYTIQPLLAHLALPIPGVNLGSVSPPTDAPTVPAPVYQKGIAGGVASLDSTGKIPADQLPDDIGGGTALTSYETQVEGLPDYPTTFPPDTTGLAAVATSGAYGDLSGRPTIPTVPSTLPPTDGSVTAAKMASGLVAMTTAERSKLTDLPADAQSAAQVAATVAGLVASAPAALDTLDELAAALGDDANFATTVTTALAAKAPTANPTFTGAVTVPDGSFSLAKIIGLVTALAGKADADASPPEIESTALNTWPTRAAGLAAKGSTGYTGRVVWRHRVTDGVFAPGVTPTLPAGLAPEDDVEWTAEPA
jgi:hypothetical protein